MELAESFDLDAGLLQKSWSIVLSQYAALKGKAVPVIRFERAEITLDGVDIDLLSTQSAIAELWRTRFPRALVKPLSIRALDSAEFPLLIIDGNTSELGLIRGRAGSSGLLVEYPDKRVEEYDRSVLESSNVQILTASVEDQLTPSNTNKLTATGWFASALSAYRSIFIEAILATFIISLVGLGSAMYTMQVYDRVVPTQGYSTLIVLGIGVLLAILMELIIKQSRAYMVDKACKAIDQDLSAVFFGKALDIRLDALPKTVGTFASQIRHFESVRNFMTSSTLFIFADAPFALFFILVIGLIGGYVALVPLFMVPIAIAIGMAFRRPIERHTQEHMAESNKKNGLLVDAIDGMESLKAANADWKVLGNWRELTRITAESELKVRSLSSLSTNLTQTIQQLSYAGMISVGAYLITVGELTMGALIACSIIGGRALAPLAQIPSLIVQWKQAKIALDVLDGIMSLPSERESTLNLIVPDHCQGDLKLENISFGYNEELPVLTVEKLQIKSGERIAVLGAIGSGKSTLLKTISGMVKPQGGKVSLDGLDIQLLAPEFVRENIGYLPQDVRLFSGTLKENLLLGLPLFGDSVLLDACRTTGLDAVIGAHPMGLDLPIAEGGKGLSGGQRQLVGLTRMLLAKPKVLLMDEPTASMDGQTEARVMKHLFAEVPKTNTLIVVTHKVALLPHVDRIIVVDKSRVVLDGPKEKVLATIKAQTLKSAEQATNNQGGQA